MFHRQCQVLYNKSRIVSDKIKHIFLHFHQLATSILIRGASKAHLSHLSTRDYVSILVRDYVSILIRDVSVPSFN